MANPLLYLIPTPGNVLSIILFLIGVVYPTFESFKAIESSEIKDDTQWLSYWVVFAIYTCFEALLWPVLRWIPLYKLTKIGATLWMVAPQYNGATFVYHKYAKPALYIVIEKSRQIPQLEPYLKDFSTTSKAVKDATKKVENVVTEAEEKLQEQANSYAPMKSHAQ